VSASDIERITATGPEEFRAWLDEHHDTTDAVWLVYYKKNSETPSITWPEAVDEALCYGWIDSKIQSIDNDRYEQYFCPRKPTSPWSKVNKTKIESLQLAKRIQPAGAAAIETAKENGSWSILDDAENHIVPDDLAAALADRDARKNFRPAIAVTPPQHPPMDRSRKARRHPPTTTPTDRRRSASRQSTQRVLTKKPSKASDTAPIRTSNTDIETVCSRTARTGAAGCAGISRAGRRRSAESKRR
jgi:uncharacterized protein YdeI (YjbR/CyaY-like superfamily)